ncbi:unnamed protein product [Lampetra planeri]
MRPLSPPPPPMTHARDKGGESRGRREGRRGRRRGGGERELLWGGVAASRSLRRAALELPAAWPLSGQQRGSPRGGTPRVRPGPRDDPATLASETWDLGAERTRADAVAPQQFNCLPAAAARGKTDGDASPRDNYLARDLGGR